MTESYTGIIRLVEGAEEVEGDLRRWCFLIICLLKVETEVD
jgi:hypothetical protein